MTDFAKTRPTKRRVAQTLTMAWARHDLLAIAQRYDAKEPSQSGNTRRWPVHADNTLKERRRVLVEQHRICRWHAWRPPKYASSTACILRHFSRPTWPG